MHLHVLATDLDGTIATNGQVADATWEALRRARRAGISLMLVTGRSLASFVPEGPFAELFEAIVAEDGAVVYFPRRDAVVLPFGQLDPELERQIDALNLPLEHGVAIVATHVPHDAAIVELLRRVGGGAVIEYNRGAAMVLPSGATKGTGLAYALRELGYGLHNVLACGDAENDRSLFEGAELAVAVANATPEAARLADAVLDRPDGEGVQRLISGWLDGRLPARRCRPTRQLLLGKQRNGTPITIDPWDLTDGRLGILGASGSGKSWLAGMLAEELLAQGYQICIIDPEGDHRSLHIFPHTVTFGGANAPLPPVFDVLTLSEYASINLLFDLSAVSDNERISYLHELLPALHALRARRGRPHWILIDEVQCFCPEDASQLTHTMVDLLAQGGVGIVSHRPTLVAPSILRQLDSWLLGRLGTDESATLDPFLGAWPDWAHLRTALANLPPGQSELISRRACGNSANSAVLVRTGPRSVPHIRHLHKYLRAPLPAAKQFYFRDPSGQRFGSAASLWEFCGALERLPLDVLRYHLLRGDFERWLQEIIHDAELARRLHKIARRGLPDAVLREELMSVVTSRYEELERLL